jgi:hypothetical protein
MAGERSHELEALYRSRGFTLAFDHRGNQWTALLMRADIPIGAALVVGRGETRDEAAEDVHRQFEAKIVALQPLNIEGKATVTAELTVIRAEDHATGTDDAQVTAKGIPSEEAFGVPTVEQLPKREVLSQATLKKLGGAHFQVAWVPEPDRSWTWYLAASDGEILQSGTAEDFEDAKLSSVLDAHPPSNEDAALGDRSWDR